MCLCIFNWVGILCRVGMVWWYSNSLRRVAVGVAVALLRVRSLRAESACGELSVDSRGSEGTMVPGKRITTYNLVRKVKSNKS